MLYGILDKESHRPYFKGSLGFAVMLVERMRSILSTNTTLIPKEPF